MLEMWLEINTSVAWKDVIVAIDSPAIPHGVSSNTEDTAGKGNVLV